jgi:hypothetical protein
MRVQEHWLLLVGLVGGDVAREALAPVLLSLGTGSCAYRLVCLQAGAEATADGCGRRDEPGEDEEARVRGVSTSLGASWLSGSTRSN